MNSLSKENKILYTIITLNIIAIGIYVFGYIYISESNHKIARYTSDISTANNLKDNSNSTAMILKDTKSDRQKLDSFFIATDGSVDFLKTVENLAKEIGVGLETTSIGIEGTQDPKSSVEELVMNITVEGSWEEVFQFYGLLESLPFSTKIRTFVLQTDYNNQSSSVGWKMHITFSSLKIK